MNILNQDIRNVPLAEIQEHPNNARKGDMGAIQSSVDENGFWGTIVVQKSTGFIVAGNHRYRAAREAGFKEVPVAFVDVDDTKAKKILAADNRTSDLGDYDNEALAHLLDDLNTEDALFGTGYDVGDLDELISALPKEIDVSAFTRQPPGQKPETEPVPAAAEDPTTKPGDLWELGDHRLLCGDSTKPEDLQRLMGGEQARLWLTDPPYNVALGMNETPEQARKRNRRTDGLVVSNDSMEDGEFRSFLLNAYMAADAVMAPGAAFYVWHADSEGYNFRGAARDAGWTVRQCLVWVKNSLVLGRQDYQWQHEPCLYGWKDGAAHFWGSDRKQTTILEFDKPAKNPDHPTMKPIELFQYQVENSSRPGDPVLDSFGGSGTTIIACERSDRRGFLCELDPRYCDVIVKRWENFTGRKAVLKRPA